MRRACMPMQQQDQRVSRQHGASAGMGGMAQSGMVHGGDVVQPMRGMPMQQMGVQQTGMSAQQSHAGSQMGGGGMIQGAACIWSNEAWYEGLEGHQEHIPGGPAV